MRRTFKVDEVRNSFPIFKKKFLGRKLIYFDNAATTQKPKEVIRAMTDYYETYNSNIHRATYGLSSKSSSLYENVRNQIKEMINSRSAREIIFTYGTTDSINIVANSFFKKIFKKKDEIILTVAEHHSNFIPWKKLCNECGGGVKIIPVNSDGEMDIEKYKKALSKKTKLVSIFHASNITGAINPIKKIVKIAHENLTPVLVDGAQMVAHQKIDVQALDCDFYVFSGHKMFGPTGTGVLYGKEELLNNFQPTISGGGIIKDISKGKIIYEPLPYRLEPGTRNIAGVIGLGASIKYIKNFNARTITKYENELLDYAKKTLKKFKDLEIISDTKKKKIPILSFTIKGINSADIALILDSFGITIRAGNHCAIPFMQWLEISGASRISLSFYNTKDEIDRMAFALGKVYKIFAKKQNA